MAVNSVVLMVVMMMAVHSSITAIMIGHVDGCGLIASTVLLVVGCLMPWA